MYPLVHAKIAYCKGKGVPTFFFNGILIFLLVRSPCKISKPYDNPFWEKVTQGERREGEIRAREKTLLIVDTYHCPHSEPQPKKERRRNMPTIVATYICASSHGQRSHSARTNYFSFTLSFFSGPCFSTGKKTARVTKFCICSYVANLLGFMPPPPQ